MHIILINSVSLLSALLYKPGVVFKAKQSELI